MNVLDKKYKSMPIFEFDNWFQ